MQANSQLARLAAYCGKDYLHLVGSGTTGLALALRALGIEKAFVVVPNNVCFSVLLAVLSSGNEPLFCDIDENTQGICPDKLGELIGGARAVIAVHNYGIACDIRRIKAICSEKNVALIEDVSVALGGTSDGVPLGAFGDLSVFSFGAGKLLNVGHGGLIATNDSRLRDRIVSLTDGLPAYSQEAKQAGDSLSKQHTLFYNRYFLSEDWDHLASYSDLADNALQWVEYAFDEEYLPRLTKALEDIDRLINLRRENWGRLKEKIALLDNDAVTVMECSLEAVPWRLNLLMKTGRNDVLKMFLAKGEKVSSWHPSLDVFFRPRSMSNIRTPRCDEVGDRILNLWINEEIDGEYLERSASLLENYLNGG